MPRALIPCPSCHRHVVAREASCPFCANSLPTLSRRTLATLTAVSLGLAVSGCPSKERPAPKYGMPPQPDPDPNGRQLEPEAPMYGMPAPPPDASAPEEPQPAPAPDTGEEQAAPMYGMPSPPENKPESGS